MKQLFSIIFLLLIAGGLSAQQITARLDLGRRDPLPKYFKYCSEDGGLVTLGNMSRKSSRYIGLFKYDKNFNQEWSVQVFTNNGRKNVDFLAVIGDNILVFVSEYFPKERMIVTYYYQYDLQGNAIVENKKISELANEREHRVDLQYEMSINKQMLICYKNLDFNREDEKILYYLFDDHVNQLRNGELILPYTDDKFRMKSMRISNEGDIYILGKYYVRGKVSTPDDYSFMLFKFPFDGESPSEIPLNFGDKFITDLEMKVDPNKNVYIAGFWSRKSSSNIIGTVYLRLNPANELEINSSQEFTESFLANFLKDKQIDKGKELRFFYLDNIILRSDGGVLLLAEKYYTTATSYWDSFSGLYVDRKIYHYDEIIINSVSPEGELEWSSYVPKRQSSEYRENLSYLDVVTGSDIWLMYEYWPHKSARTIYYNTVSMDGEVSSREALYDKFGKNITFYPIFSEQISNSEALLVYYQEKEKTYSIVKMRF